MCICVLLFLFFSYFYCLQLLQINSFVFGRCNDGRQYQIPTVKVTVKAAAVKPEYIVTLGGTTEMVREEHDVSHGTAIFRDLLILSMPAAKTSDVLYQTA